MYKCYILLMMLAIAKLSKSQNDCIKFLNRANAELDKGKSADYVKAIKQLNAY